MSVECSSGGKSIPESSSFEVLTSDDRCDDRKTPEVSRAVLAVSVAN